LVSAGVKTEEIEPLMEQMMEHDKNLDKKIDILEFNELLNKIV